MLIINCLAGLLIITSLSVSCAKTAKKSTALYALQSLVLVLLFVALASSMQAHQLYMWSISAFVTKVLLVPALFYYFARKLETSALAPVFNSVWLIPISAIIVVACYLAVQPLQLPIAEHLKPTLSVSLSHFLIGLLCIVSQRNILQQVFGYCLMENGSHLSLALLASNAPELVEIGIATDAVFAVLIMLVLVKRIYQHIGSLDAKQLMQLRG